MTTRECRENIGQLKDYYRAQARWTRAARNYLYRRTNLLRAENILEVGCGTGEITGELIERTRARITAVDIDGEAVDCTRARCPEARVIHSDAGELDLPDASFDAAVCHFTLMWCADPASVVARMARLVKDKGFVVALSEPDYGGLVEYPESIACGPLIAGGLRGRGADPLAGRKVRGFFRDALLETEVGLASAVWGAGALRSNLEAHYRLIRDRAGESELERIRAAHGEALERDVVVFFLPVFWACGQKNS